MPADASGVKEKRGGIKKSVGLFVAFFGKGIDKADKVRYNFTIPKKSFAALNQF